MIESMLDSHGKECVIERKTVIEGDCSGDTVLWNTIATITAVKGSLRGRDSIKADKMGISATGKLFCLPIDVKEEDRVKIENQYYKVTFVEDPMSVSEFLQIWIERSDNYDGQSN
jgi:hypothetical protein